MSGLGVRFLRNVYSPDGPHAELMLIEPNGDEHKVLCLCRIGGQVDVGEDGSGEVLRYLNDRYGFANVGAICEVATLSNSH